MIPSRLLLIASGLVLAVTVWFSIWTLRGGGMPPKPLRRARLGQRIRRARRRRWEWRLRGYRRARGLS